MAIQFPGNLVDPNVGEFLEFFFFLLDVPSHSLVPTLIISSDLVDDQLRITKDLQTVDLEGSV